MRKSALKSPPPRRSEEGSRSPKEDKRTEEQKRLGAQAPVTPPGGPQKKAEEDKKEKVPSPSSPNSRDGGRTGSPYSSGGGPVPQPERKRREGSFEDPTGSQTKRSKAKGEVREESQRRGEPGEVLRTPGGQQRGRKCRNPKRKRERKERKAKRQGQEGSLRSGQGVWPRWRKELRDLPEVPLHILGYTRRILKALVGAAEELKAALRLPSHSPHGREGPGRGNRSIYPLPLPQDCRDAMELLVTPTAVQKQLGKRVWSVCEKPWWGLLIIGLNSGLGFTSEIGSPQNPMQEKVLALLAVDAADFVRGDGLGCKDGRCKFPEVPWSKRMGDLSLSYVGEIMEKARWLTWEQVEPGLPPLGVGRWMHAPSVMVGYQSI